MARKLASGGAALAVIAMVSIGMASSASAAELRRLPALRHVPSGANFD